MTNRDHAILRAVAAFLKGFASRIEQRFQVLELKERGLDGEPGQIGPAGPEGQPGRDGRDGLPGRPGDKGLDGKDGRDGLSLENFTVEKIGDRRFMLVLQSGETRKEAVINFDGIVLDAGVFREESDYVKGDGVTYGGSFWIAQKASKGTRPGTSDAWRLAVKQGRDGKQGPAGIAGKDGAPGKDGKNLNPKW